jgi:hypothetical protein
VQGRRRREKANRRRPEEKTEWSDAYQLGPTETTSMTATQSPWTSQERADGRWDTGEGNSGRQPERVDQSDLTH